MITQSELSRFMEVRARLFQAIKEALAEDGHCKSYEGALWIKFPCYFEGDLWRIKLDCYVIGPSRHYEWEGQSFEESLTKAETDILWWIKEKANE